MTAKITDAEVRQRLADAKLEPVEPLCYRSNRQPIGCICLICGADASPQLDCLARQGGCRECGWRATGAGQRLKEEEVRRLLDGANVDVIEPLDYKNTKTGIPSRCRTCKKTVYPKVGTLRRGDGGCFGCGARKRGAAKRIPTEEILHLLQVNRLTLKGEFNYSSKDVPIPCTCNDCGADVGPRLATLRRGFGACQECAWKANGISFRLTEAEVRQVLAEARQIPNEPLMYRGVHEAIPCICDICKSPSRPTLASLRSRDGGCAICGREKMSAHRSAARAAANVGWVYLLRSPCDTYRKFGVSISIEGRLGQLARVGFTDTIQLIELSPVSLAYRVEMAIKRHMFNCGIGPAKSRSEMYPWGGWTETFLKDDAPDLLLTPFVDQINAEAAAIGEALHFAASPTQLTFDLWAA